MSFFETKYRIVKVGTSYYGEYRKWYSLFWTRLFVDVTFDEAYASLRDSRRERAVELEKRRIKRREQVSFDVPPTLDTPPEGYASWNHFARSERYARERGDDETVRD